jgi:hypothetical protein
MQIWPDRSLLPLRVVAFLHLLVTANAGVAHDDLAMRMLAEGETVRAEWFESLKTRSGESCCSQSDCRQTTAEWRGDTQGWWVLVNGSWRPVPADKVLAFPKSIDGAAYLCSGRDSRGSAPDGGKLRTIPSVLSTIYCFVPPDFGS